MWLRRMRALAMFKGVNKPCRGERELCCRGSHMTPGASDLTPGENAVKGATGETKKRYWRCGGAQGKGQLVWMARHQTATS